MSDREIVAEQFCGSPGLNPCFTLCAECLAQADQWLGDRPGVDVNAKLGPPAAPLTLEALIAKILAKGGEYSLSQAAGCRPEASVRNGPQGQLMWGEDEEPIEALTVAAKEAGII